MHTPTHTGAVRFVFEKVSSHMQCNFSQSTHLFNNRTSDRATATVIDTAVDRVFDTDTFTYTVTAIVTDRTTVVDTPSPVRFVVPRD